MGSWDISPWDNDAAADWFGSLMDETNLPVVIENTLNKDVKNYAEEIRAAALILIFLGRVYIWPIDKLDLHLEMAKKKLQEIIDITPFGEDADFISQIQSEIKLLDSRLGKSPPPDEVKTYWKSLI